MTSSDLVSRKARIAGAVFCIMYLCIQSFQVYVYGTIPEPLSITDVLLQGALPLHKLRSFLLLISFFLLIYVFIAVVFYDFRKHKISYSFALIGFLIFCCLEIGIRSVEYFYVQLQLPNDYVSATTDIAKAAIIDKFSAFQSVQASLYFPLMLSQAISSVIVAVNFPLKPKQHLAIKIAFTINAFRLAGRLLAMTVNVHWFDSFSGPLYFPFVITVFGLLTYWFLFSRDVEQRPSTKYLQKQG